MVSKSFNTGTLVKVEMEKAYKHFYPTFTDRKKCIFFFFLNFYLLDLDCIFEAGTDILEFKNLITIQQKHYDQGVYFMYGETVPVITSNIYLTFSLLSFLVTYQPTDMLMQICM